MAPFKSEAQRKFMHASKPKLAKEFEAATPKGIKLPKRVKKKKAAVKKKMTKEQKVIKYKSIAKRKGKK